MKDLAPPLRAYIALFIGVLLLVLTGRYCGVAHTTKSTRLKTTGSTTTTTTHPQAQIAEAQPPTTLEPHPTTPHRVPVATASVGQPRPIGGGESSIPISSNLQVVVSTAYHQGTRTASGTTVHFGEVAMNGVPFGAKFKALDGPYAGTIFTVEDRWGCCTQFDIYVNSEAEAVSYGRRTLRLLRVG